MKKLFISLVMLQVLLQVNAQEFDYEELDINNIKARFFANGALFGGEIGGNGFEVPIGSGKSTFYSARLWIGGIDVNGQLHLAAERYGQIGNDYFPGVLTTDGAANCLNGVDSIYNKVWKINKSAIDTFIQVSNQSLNVPGYVIPEVIRQWPSEVAPFVDVNGDGQYFPQFHGDYPKIRGDQALFFVFNDNCGLHTESAGSAIGVEIHGMAYVYKCPQDSALFNTIFVHYDIINHGSLTLNNTYVGLWSDMDLGFANDDFVQCDVMRGSYFIYNGIAIDGSGNPDHYGIHPPAQSVTFLGGPYQDANGIDDAFGIGVDESLNGFGFGDGIIDNERRGMNRFIYHNNDNGAQGDPTVAINYYNYMKGIWMDGTMMTYGGNALGGSIPAWFMFPGNSDQQYFLGTNATPVPPWTEETAGNVPYDRRGLGSSGPFTLEPGEIVPLDFAFVFGRDYNGGPQESIAVMKERIDAIRAMFFADSTTCGGGFTSVEENYLIKNAVLVYPNPAKNFITLSCAEQTQLKGIELFDVNGCKVISDKFQTGLTKIQIDLSELSSGIYFLRISSDDELVCVKKIIKN